MQIYHQPHNSMGNHTYNSYFYDNAEYEPHFHKNYEFIFVTEGQLSCTVNGQTRILDSGSFALCLSNQVHSFNTVGRSKIWVGVFSEDFIYEFKKEMTGKCGVDFCFSCTPKITEFIRENLIKKALTDIFMIKACLYALCSEYLRQIPTAPLTRQNLLMGDIVEYIDNNYQKSISLHSLADSLGYEYCYFSRLFNQIFSMSFSNYLSVYRFNKACIMLIKTDASITEIAYESGFQSIRSFNDTFKKLAGISPYSYRTNKKA